jgi:hypothetical protein
MGHDCRGSNAVAVIITEDAYPFFGLHGTRKALGGDCSIGHQVRRSQLSQSRIEKSTRDFEVMQPSTAKELGRRS